MSDGTVVFDAPMPSERPTCEANDTAGLANRSTEPFRACCIPDSLAISKCKQRPSRRNLRELGGGRKW